MKAAVIVDIEVENITEYKEYIESVTPTVLERGGSYLVRGGNPETLDGDWISKRMVVMQFPSREIAKAWLNDESLADIHNKRRSNASKCNMIVCDMVV